MDEQARRERLEMMMARKIALEEHQEDVRMNIEARQREYLEQCAAERKLRRAEIIEMRRLRQDNIEIARQIRRAQMQERRERFEKFCERAAEFLQREQEFMQHEEEFIQRAQEFSQRTQKFEQEFSQRQRQDLSTSSVRVYEVMDITLEPQSTDKDKQRTER